jgi:hypothetical protein
MPCSSEVDLAELIAQLPLGRRRLLARGPMLPGEMQAECRVCEALGEPWTLRCVAGAPRWIEDAALPLFDYHAAEGNKGEAAYRRCVAIYRAAGWTGEYDARDLHGFEGDDG